MSDNQNGNRPPRNPLTGGPEGDRSRRPNVPGGPPQPPRRPRVPSWIVVVLLVSIVGWYAYQFFLPNDSGSRTSIPYSVFISLVDSKTVDTATVTSSNVDAD